MIDTVKAASFDPSSLAVGRAGMNTVRTPQVGPGDATQSTDFATVLARTALQAVDTLKAGEAAAITGIQGKASVQQVAEAVMAAEQTLQSAIAVRDKVVAAYLELSRMQI